MKLRYRFVNWLVKLSNKWFGWPDLGSGGDN